MIWRAHKRSHHKAPHDRLQLGARAEALLNDPVLALAFELVEQDLVKRWHNTMIGQHETREAAYRLYWALQEVRSKLTGILGNAKLIRSEHARKEKEQQQEEQRRMGLA